MHRLPLRFLDIPLKRGFEYVRGVCKVYVYDTYVEQFFFICFFMYGSVFNVGNCGVNRGGGNSRGEDRTGTRGTGVPKDKINDSHIENFENFVM